MGSRNQGIKFCKTYILARKEVHITLGPMEICLVKKLTQKDTKYFEPGQEDVLRTSQKSAGPHPRQAHRSKSVNLSFEKSALGSLAWEWLLKELAPWRWWISDVCFWKKYLLMALFLCPLLPECHELNSFSPPCPFAMVYLLWNQLAMDQTVQNHKLKVGITFFKLHVSGILSQ